jgi:hypothetical protein
MPLWECCQLLHDRSIGRLVVTEGEFPVAYPVSYAITERTAGTLPAVLVRTRPGGVIDRALGPASLQLDEVDIAAGRAWSIIARGRLQPLQDLSGMPAPHPWLSDDRHRWLMLDVQAVTGRRFVAVADQTFSVDWQYGPG